MALTAFRRIAADHQAVWRIAPVMKSMPWGKRERIKFA
jgi:hypothetical protein